MAKYFKWALINVAFVPLFFFTNTTPLVPNQQAITNFTFGPSIRSQDGRYIFANTPTYAQFWDRVSNSSNSLIITSLLLDNEANFNNFNHREHIALSNGQLDNLGRYLAENDMGLIVELGAGLNMLNFYGDRTLGATDPCSNFSLANNFRNPLPSDIEDGVISEMQILSRLSVRNIRISEINIDGPFLRLLEGSRKEFSCGTRGNNTGGFTLEQSSHLILFYIKMMKTRIEAMQGGAPVKVNLVVNLPNWKYDANPAINSAWWSNNPSVLLREALNSLSQLSRNSPNYRVPIHSVVVDYPFSYIEGSAQRMTHFRSKISLLAEQIKTLNAPGVALPKLSIIANTSGEFVAQELKNCISRGDFPQLAPFSALSICTEAERSSITAQHQASDSAYLQKTQRYLTLINTNLPTNVRVHSVLVQSWHASPRLNSDYGAAVSNMIDAITPAN